jgi:hypothetical protein
MDLAEEEERILRKSESRKGEKESICAPYCQQVKTVK